MILTPDTLTHLIELGTADDTAAEFQRATHQMSDEQLSLLMQVIDGIKEQTRLEDRIVELDAQLKAAEEELLSDAV